MTTHRTNGVAEADYCREHGLLPGTRLVGDEGYGPTVIEITGLGERKILATAISHKGVPIARCETTWTLSRRDWSVVDVTPGSDGNA